ncbi:cation diffusion facilitator family transporter [Sphingosinicellaceae bacterium]|nr:cation diffusion facilitator family transporter [Sphingosinicellaceae bacterium]
MAQESKLVVVAALIGNLAIAVTKFVAAAVTGSSALLSEAVHSLVDTGNEVLLLYGLHRAALPPDAELPLGHGRELYFWSFVVALLIFAGGAGVSIYEGIHHLQNPNSIERPGIVFAVLGAAFVFEGISWMIALRAFRRAQGEQSWWQAFRSSKDPATFMVLFEDSAALAGILVAAAGVGLALVTGDPRWDGVASIVIGAILGIVALILGRESKALLLGERADPALSAAILELASTIPGVEHANGVATIQLAPDQVVVTLSVDFIDSLRTPEIETAVKALEACLRAAHPEISAVFVKPQSAGEAARRRERGDAGIFADEAG